jgi:hypothetical protein
MSLRDDGQPRLLDLFSFEEMTTHADEARILGLRAALPTSSTPLALWLDVPTEGVSAFNLLAAHPRLLGPAHAHINADVRAVFLRIWVGTASAATPAALPIVAPDHDGAVTAVICLNGFAKLSVNGNPTLTAGSVVWLDGGAQAELTIDGPVMLCLVAYQAVKADASLQAVADDSLWPAAYVSAG